VPDYIKEGQELRVLKLTPEDLGCPCGGTHVKAASEIIGIEIKAIKKKKKNTQVTYKVVDDPNSMKQSEQKECQQP